MDKNFISPIYNVKKIPIHKIRANSYNPNVVAPVELKLLEESILIDGYTMPIVCYYLKNEDLYEIVDGYHRFLVMKNSEYIATREGQSLPVVIIDKQEKERIASTIRHNRARGTHSIDRMVEIIQNLVDAGLSDQWIMKNLGMDEDELIRLKQISGLATLFVDREFSKAWEEI
ncbi:ParB N-terminal domain-containing protein [Enterococcus hirae]|nr:ParB N-terminal domain-containing protein [Enterococcus hirae]NBA56628.1 ParB N-terminal domain-containing protein [Enterococcus hirae]